MDRRGGSLCLSLRGSTLCSAGQPRGLKRRLPELAKPAFREAAIFQNDRVIAGLAQYYRSSRCLVTRLVKRTNDQTCNAE